MAEGFLDENGRIRWASENDVSDEEHDLPEPPDGNDEDGDELEDDDV
jgi:hypothetical protein